MAIPGSKAKIEPSAKVRIGVTKVSSSGKRYPAAVDYFVCDNWPGDEPNSGWEPDSLEIRFLHSDVEDAFSTGLEWWIRGRDDAGVLACYTKDGGDEPVALRLDKMLDPGQEAIGPPRGRGRLPIRCPVHACPHLQDRACKPMGRLVFALDGDNASTPLQLDTKSWNSTEKLTGALTVARTVGPLNDGRVFRLSVKIVTKGGDRFPVLSLDQVLDTGEAIIAVEQTEGDNRTKLIAALRARGRDPASPAVVDWVKTHGVDEALRRVMEVSQ